MKRSPFRGWVISEWFGLVLCVLVGIWAVGGLISLGPVLSSHANDGFGLPMWARGVTIFFATMPVWVTTGYEIYRFPGFLRKNPPIWRDNA